MMSAHRTGPGRLSDVHRRSLVITSSFISIKTHATFFPLCADGILHTRLLVPPCKTGAPGMYWDSGTATLNTSCAFLAVLSVFPPLKRATKVKMEAPIATKTRVIAVDVALCVISSPHVYKNAALKSVAKRLRYVSRLPAKLVESTDDANVKPSPAMNPAPCTASHDLARVSIKAVLAADAKSPSGLKNAMRGMLGGPAFKQT